MKTLPLAATLLALSLLVGHPTIAQTHSHDDDDPLVETGQATFAAIAEIVEALMADPKTDWTKVDIPALRWHLIDMHEVTMNAVVATTVDGRTVLFRASGAGRTVEAIQRMLVAHAGSDDLPPGWVVSAAVLPDGAELAVTTNEIDDALVVEALGLIGVLTLGAHHERHHLQMATGKHHH